MEAAITSVVERVLSEGTCLHECFGGDETTVAVKTVDVDAVMLSGVPDIGALIPGKKKEESGRVDEGSRRRYIRKLGCNWWLMEREVQLMRCCLLRRSIVLTYER